MTHDPMCERYAIASSRDCWACKAIADARADEREKAAISERQAIEDRIVAAYQGFDVPAKLKAAIYAAVWGEQE